MRESRRPSVDLDGEWRFVADPDGLYSLANLPNGRPIRVPGVWEAQLEQPWGIVHGWYRRRFHLPADWGGSPVLLQFGAVMYRCRAWLNGYAVGEHEGGYTGFGFHVGRHVLPGEDNELTLLVSNPLNAISDYPALSEEEVRRHQELTPELPLAEVPHGKQTWYASMSGPWKSVRVERVPPTRIGGLRILPEARAARITARWRLGGELVPEGTGLRLSILDPDGREVAAESRQLERDESAGSWQLSIPSPQLWDIGRPNLYRALLTLAPGMDGEDHLAVRFGMRDIRVEGGRILLNERPIYVRAALDQDVYADTIWSPPSREYLQRQVQQAQQMGLNMLRCHIKVPDPAYVDAADEAGLLLWCELPNWTVFSDAAARRGRQTLEAMVEELGNSPSIVAWTIINEDWGTELRQRPRDRLWLRREVEWLRQLDPTRLVIDNSACNTAHGPNFHLDTDLADFHIYHGFPDNAARWRSAIEEYAARPAWLWSPHGDARRSGNEALVLSEFGNWGLPRLDRLVEFYQREPWWFDTGRQHYRPRGLAGRFDALGLGRLFGNVNELAEATQWQQYEALRYEIGELRRHGSISGYVITEFTDAFWEANGLLDVTRGEKVFHGRLAEINSDDVVVADLDRTDLWDDEPLHLRPVLSSYGPPVEGGGRLAWRLSTADGQERRGEEGLTSWPRYGVLRLDDLLIQLPTVAEPSEAELELVCRDDDGRPRARDVSRVLIVPASRRTTDQPLAVAVHDPLDLWSLAERFSSLGHALSSERSAGQVLVASALTDDLLGHVSAGLPALVLLRDSQSLPDELALARRVRTQARNRSQDGDAGQHNPWDGEWIGSFNWILPTDLAGLPPRQLLDRHFSEVAPDHVLTGYDPARHRDEVTAGMFVGWVHAPAALVWTFAQGLGRLTLTTFRLSPEAGPVATVLLEGLLQKLARRDAPRDSQIREVR